LGELRDIEGQIQDAGFQWIAIVPDMVTTNAATRRKYGVHARFLSDTQMKAAQAFRVAYQVDEPTLESLRKYGVDLEAASGEKHHQLPVPAVFVVNAAGVIQFAYVNPNYSVRLQPQLLLAALKPAAKSG
jgi:peroxiredoxin